MPTSTTTLLEAANAVLLNCNERPLGSLTSPIGQQVRLALRTALTQLTAATDWVWLRNRINADEWSSDLAQLASNVVGVDRVTWDSGYRHIEIPQVHSVEFSAFPLYAGTRPLIWTRTIEYVQVRPYPTTDAEKAAIWFHVRTSVDLPTSESGVFAIPERVITLLILLASSIFALQHMEDQGLYTTFRGEYELLMQQMRSNYERRAFNMYGGSRLRTDRRYF